MQIKAIQNINSNCKSNREKKKEKGNALFMRFNNQSIDF